MKSASNDSSDSGSPKVSIVLPTYNRADYLPNALAAIHAQTYTNWELIVVDDGSTDHTDALLSEWQSQLGAKLKIIRQANQGAYAARNAGVRSCSCEFIAFYDSDDRWRSYHLQNCMEVFNADPRISWVYGAQRGIDGETGEIVFASSFYENDQPRPFLKLNAKQVGHAHVITDPNVLACAISNELHCPLQNSVLRHHLFEKRKFRPELRNGEDRLFCIRQLFDGTLFAYCDNIHVDYFIHETNSSVVARHSNPADNIAINRSIIAGYQQLKEELQLSRHLQKLLQHRNAHTWWQLGYKHLELLEYALATECFWRALKLRPTSARYWKSTVGSYLKRLSWHSPA
jgi:glycosyltransferase involved in cell wall biosynthesis